MPNKKILNFITCFLISIFIWSCSSKPEVFVDTSGLTQTDSDNRSFVIHNKGSAKLSILDIVTSCECTTLNLKKGDEIAEGDSLRVQVKILREEQDADNEIYVTLKTNAKPQLTSFHFPL